MSTLSERLRAWAAGSLPCMAAVDFLIATGTDLTLVTDDGSWARLDLFELTPEEWEDRTGGMSGGEYATWTIARSLVAGELNDAFWRLDGSRKRALLEALAAQR